MKRPDPLGKRALFSAPEPDEPKAGPLDVRVRCSACETRTTTSIVNVIRNHLPLWFWMPGRKPGHLMRCSTCHEVAWHDISRAASP